MDKLRKIIEAINEMYSSKEYGECRLVIYKDMSCNIYRGGGDELLGGWNDVDDLEIFIRNNEGKKNVEIPNK